jgi:hypothetical protein
MFFIESKMNHLIRNLPEDIENEIKSLIFTKSMRLTMLLDKYPLNKMDTLFNGFTKDQLDRVYRYGCVSKVLAWGCDGYTWNAIQPTLNDIFKNDNRDYRLFTYTCWPVAQFNYYWQTQIKKCQPSKPEYIRRITNFCIFVLASSKRNPNPNEKFVSFCEKLVSDVVIGSLIMRKNI